MIKKKNLLPSENSTKFGHSSQKANWAYKKYKWKLHKIMVQIFNKNCNICESVFQNRFVVYRLRWFQQLIEFGFRKKNF